MLNFPLAQNIKVDFNSDCSTYVRCKLSKKRGQRIEFAAPKWVKDWLDKSGFGEDVVSKAVINGIYSTVFKIGPNPRDRFSGGSSMFANNEKLDWKISLRDVIIKTPAGELMIGHVRNRAVNKKRRMDFLLSELIAQ